MAAKSLSRLAISAFLVLACSSSSDSSGDHVRPTVTIDQSVTQVDPTNAVQIEFTARFSEPVTGFTAADLNFTGSTVGGTIQALIVDAGLRDGAPRWMRAGIPRWARPARTTPFPSTAPGPT